MSATTTIDRKHLPSSAAGIMRRIPMKRACILAASFTAAFATIALADSPQPRFAPAQAPQTQPPQTQAPRRIPPPLDPGYTGFVLRQDLFDRNNPNNLQSDYPAPPRQAGQF